jgi:hypothetical protein
MEILTAAAKSSCPATPGLAAPPDREAATPPGLGATGGAGGFAGSFGALPLCLAAIAGATGLGLVVIGGGGLLAARFVGRGCAGTSSDGLVGFFHGVVDPLEDPMPGKTETGFAVASAVRDWAVTLGVAAGVGVDLETGGGRRCGGGGGAGEDLGLGGASSR